MFLQIVYIKLYTNIYPVKLYWELFTSDVSSENCTTLHILPVHSGMRSVSLSHGYQFRNALFCQAKKQIQCACFSHLPKTAEVLQQKRVSKKWFCIKLLKQGLEIALGCCVQLAGRVNLALWGFCWLICVCLVLCPLVVVVGEEKGRASNKLKY